jgi:hypothetical protein
MLCPVPVFEGVAQPPSNRPKASAIALACIHRPNRINLAFLKLESAQLG